MKLLFNDSLTSLNIPINDNHFNDSMNNQQLNNEHVHNETVLNSTTHSVSSTTESMINEIEIMNTTAIMMNITDNITIMNDTTNYITVDYHKENLRTITTHPTIDVNSKKITEVNMNSWSSLTSLSTPYISRIEDSETQQVYRSFSAPVDVTHTKTGQATLKHQQLILKHPIERTEHKGLSYGGIVSLSILGVTFGLLLLIWFRKRCLLKKRRSKKDGKKMSLAGGKLAADLKTAAHLSEALKSQDKVALKTDMEMNEQEQAGDHEKEKQYFGKLQFSLDYDFQKAEV
ncbi:unnamed protein product [Schistosoma margrebowiei]|uniref:Uncharacterized protein n=2 Tax=Schistosoma margrebowiei TaxID=48269 RepID=A0AA85AF95_9TREM|nr:unnamed protein product [Schistosoma margrebowiei]